MGDRALKTFGIRDEIKFTKYHALGNDYIVIHPEYFKNEIDRDVIRLICNRHYGIGSDGILLGPFESESCDFGLRIFNPDGSEAEKSGNGLRIFTRFLLDNSISSRHSFTVETAGGKVKCEVSSDGHSVKVEMGKVSFKSEDIPVTGPSREVLNETMSIDGHKMKYCAATVGNPHCIVLSEAPDPVEARRLGPQIENDPRFPQRTNVQFMRIIDRNNIQIEIWERGAGYTLASGSSSTAAAAVAFRLDLCDSDITAHMPGGQIQVSFDHTFAATIRGPVTKVCDGIFSEEMFTQTISPQREVES